MKLRYLKVMAVALFATTYGLLSTPSYGAIINMDALLIGDINTGQNSVDLFLEPGTYLVTPISPPTPGAQFTAWSAWPNNDGCNADGICTGTGYHHNYLVETTSTPDVPRVELFNGLLYATALLAFQNAISFEFTLQTAQDVSFYLSDTSRLIDNRGGISLEVAPVPVPAALPLFLSAIAGMGFVGWRRRRQSAG